MTEHSSNEYFRNAVLTASPEQLQLMLYDGVIRFARQARAALLNRDWETSCEKLIRAQKITLQLQSGLRPDVNPTLCEQLNGLYGFIYQRLVDANVDHDTNAVDEALRILEHQRETWQLLLEKLRSLPAAPMPQTAVSQDSPSMLSIQG